MRKARSFLTVVLVGGLVSAACLMPAQAAAPREDVKTSFVAFKYWKGAFRGKISTEKGLCFIGQDVNVYKKRDGRTPKLVGTTSLRLGRRANGPGRFRLRTEDSNGSYFARYRKLTIAEYAHTWVCQGARSETIGV